MNRIEIRKAFSVKDDLKKGEYKWNQELKVGYKENVPDVWMSTEIGRIKAIGMLENLTIIQEKGHE